MIESKLYSSFICQCCNSNLEQFSLFRNNVLSQQKKLSLLLCRIPEDYVEPFDEPYIDLTTLEEIPEAVVIKTEVTEENIQTIFEEPLWIVEALEEELEMAEEKPSLTEQFEVIDVSSPATISVPHGERISRNECKHCDFKANYFVLKKHIRMEHPETLEDEQLRKMSKIKACDVCGKTMAKTSLREHKANVHQQSDAIFSCDLCGLKCRTKGRIKMHIFTHAKRNDPKLMCKFCGKLYDNKRSLLQHEQTHLGIVLTCDFPGCNKTFNIRTTLTGHMRYAHVLKEDYPCTYPDCKRKFKVKRLFDRHIILAHEKVRHRKCPVEGCKYTIGRVDNMKIHVKRHLELRPEKMQQFLEEVKKMNLL